MPTIKINGKPVEVAAGANLLKVCLDAGAYVPHFCWHPGLSASGNCRMCLVKISTSRKLEVACMTKCTDGLEVDTVGPEVQKARRDVLEFLLINHPLDCPVCDKAGECDLQDHTYAHRGGLSRFVEPKNVKATKDLGPTIRFWGNRCVVCTRCVRFAEEVSGSGQITVVQRGDRNTIDTFPGIAFDDPLSLNTVDVCPVGALIDKEFMYKARVWYARQTETVCARCSRGCNVLMCVLDNEIKRMVPRHNPDVNGYWMCDEGRLGTGYVAGPRRLVEGRGSLDEAIAGIPKGSGAAFAISTYHTVEEMHLVKRLAEALGAAVGVFGYAEGDRRTFKSGFTIEADRTPNTAGVKRIFGEGAVAEGVAPAVGAKRIVVLNGIPQKGWPAELDEAVARAEFSVVSDIQRTSLAAGAKVVLPALTWAEKDGTFVNFQGRAQRARKAVEPPRGAVPELWWLQEWARRLGARETPLSADGVLREAIGISHADIGPLGRAL